MERFYQYIPEVLLFPDNAIGQYNRIADAVLTLDELPNDALLWIKNPNIPEGYKGNWLIIIKVLCSASDIKHRLRCENIFDIASCFTESFLFSRSS